MKYYSYILLITLCITTSGCFLSEATKGLLGSSDTATSNDSAQVQVKPNSALSATGDSKSNQGSVDKSTTEKVDNNNDAESSTGSKNVLGSLDDDSVNNNITNSTTKNNSDDDKISRDQHNVNNGLTEKQLIIVVIGFLVMGIVMGKLIPTRRQNNTYDRLLNRSLK